MSSTTHRKQNYFHSTVQIAGDRRQTFQFCRLPFNVTSCLISRLSADKYPSIFSRQMKAIVYLTLLLRSLASEVLVSYAYTLDVSCPENHMHTSKSGIIDT